ncbi:hypothetical protein [Pseudomonas taiwanensis]|uniref:Uncharacterized protein n=1 Tax=Pseudomonas taiwanensis TaxID=470150 RepID=A0ABR6VC37_9PSED|nr:hypothetical protein [Pseudomonas taiwanensis]MBC3478017.1 hypothetical protein [Pseudomonas taiwanensis]
MIRKILFSVILSLVAVSAYALPSTEQGTTIAKLSDNQSSKSTQCEDKDRFSDQHHI